MVVAVIEWNKRQKQAGMELRVIFHLQGFEEGQ